MCCNLRIHVIVLSIIYIILAGPQYWFMEILLDEWRPYCFSSNWNYVWYYLIFLYPLVSGLMCLVGAINNNKCLLIPLMIGLCLTILVCVILLIIMTYEWELGSSGRYYRKRNYAFQSGYISIFLGPSIYILIIVAKFYKEPVPVIVARQGDWVDVPERVVLRSCVPPTVTPGSTVYVAHNTL